MTSQTNPVELTPSQAAALHLLEESDENIFLTGGPGTGKSFLIRLFLNRQKEAVPVVASTGAAAILVGGRTFHSFFGLGTEQGSLEALVDRAAGKAQVKKRLRSIRTLVIDEVSMLSQTALDAAEKVSRRLRHSNLAWGGIRIIAVGDFAQLPPISRDKDRAWCFKAAAWKRSAFRRADLTEVKRTEDAEFLAILEEIRWGRVSERVRAFLDSRVSAAEDVDPNIPHLFPRRLQTEAFNRLRLNELEGEVRVYPTEYGGSAAFRERLMRDAPVPPMLELKQGALVMLRINDPRQRFVNGTVGTVLEMLDDVLYLKVLGRQLEIEAFRFSLLDDEGAEMAYALNFPVHLAYASTIHKIQGATLERVHADLRSLWEPGQAYVALSRARSAEAVTLVGWHASSILADPRVQAFYEGRLEDDTEILTLEMQDGGAS